MVLTGEVDPSLEGEERESEAEGGGDADGHDDPPDVMVDGNGRGHDGHGQGENAHGDDIARVALPQVLAAGQGQVGHEEDDVRDQVHDEALLGATHASLHTGLGVLRGGRG